VAASRRPSFLKRQKEQARLARATEKREARRARKHAKANSPEMDSDILDPDTLDAQDDMAVDGEESEETPG
jgi:hypothetical protein